MSFITSTDLINGVGEFTPQLERVLSELSGEEFNSEDFLESFTDAAYYRLRQDHLRKNIDLDTSTFIDDQEELLQAACCYMCMTLLHDTNITSKDDRHSILSKKYEDRYNRIISGIIWNHPSGSTGPGAYSINLYRG